MSHAMLKASICGKKFSLSGEEAHAFLGEMLLSS